MRRRWPTDSHTKIIFAKNAWAMFIGHWVATGIASIRKGGPHLNLLSPPPPAQQLPASAVHIRVTATLHPAKGKQPPRAAWATRSPDPSPRPSPNSSSPSPSTCPSAGPGPVVRTLTLTRTWPPHLNPNLSPSPKPEPNPNPDDCRRRRARRVRRITPARSNTNPHNPPKPTT